MIMRDILLFIGRLIRGIMIAKATFEEPEPRTYIQNIYLTQEELEKDDEQA
jgi:hypothetical protein